MQGPVLNIRDRITTCLLGREPWLHFNDFHHRQFVSLSLCVTLSIAFLYIPMMLWLQYATGLMILFGFVLCQVAMLLLLRLGHATKMVAHGFSGMCLIGFSLTAYTTGGISSAVVAWFVAAKFGAFSFGNVRIGVFWSACNVAAALFLCWSDIKGLTPPSELQAHSQQLFSMSLHVGAMVFCAFVFLLYTFWHERDLIKLHRVNDENRNLLAILCHDISNPLSIALIQVERLLKKQVESQNPIPENQSLRKSVKALRMVVEMIDDVKVLRAQRDGLYALHLEPVELSRIIEELDLIFADRIRDKNLRFEVVLEIDPHEKMLAEPHSLARNVLGNLLSNAIKFSPVGGVIQFRALRRDKFIIIELKDQGGGVSKTDLSYFKAKGHIPSRKGTSGERGTGFGLPLVLAFLETYGGRLEIESSPGRSDQGPSGTTMRVVLRRVDEISS
jgi:signal transduction histidine kinase